MKNTFLSFLLALGIISNAQAQCTAPANLQASYANNVTTFNWGAVSGATGYVFELKQSWDSWAYPEWIDTVYTNSYTLTNIMQSISIDWRVKTLCTGTESGYTYSSNFVVPCPQPTNPTVTNISYTGATIRWSAPAGYRTWISDFVVAYRKAGTTTWTSLGHTFDTSKTISGLLPGTTYQWCVNLTCPYFNSTPLISTFTTATCNSTGSNSQEWISRFKLGTINRNSGAEAGGYVNTNTTTNMTAGASYNGQVKVGYSGAFSSKLLKIYIDYNNNTIYEETEVAYGTATLSSNTVNFTFTLPSNARNGQHGMRVIMARNGTTITGCMSGFNGETEDYKVNISGGASKGALAIAEQEEQPGKISLYPNPASSMLNVQVPGGAASITVYDLMGKKIHLQQAEGNTVQINVARWPAGQYIVEVAQQDGNRQAARFIKQ